MTTFQRALLALAVIAIVLAAWMGRYSLSVGTHHLVLDRWTGTVSIPKISDRP
jgi:hypothetical protein